MKLRLAVAIAGLALLGAACGSASTTTSSGAATATPSPSATATPTPTATADTTFAACTTQAPSASAEPTDSGANGACEVAQILFPPSGPLCSPQQGQSYASACPVTSSLGAALDRNPLSGPGGGAQPLCRCQASYMTATYMVRGVAGQPMQFIVQTKVTFGPSSTEVFDIIVMSLESGSLADDVLCGNGDPSTSIKGSSPGGCS